MDISFNLYKRSLRDLDINPEKYQGIVCPLRGGFYIADQLARKFNLPLHFIQISSYQGKIQKSFNMGIIEALPSGHYLIADDIYDTGNTISEIKQVYSHCTFDVYCLVSKMEGQGIKYSIKGKKDDWVKFWWEGENE